MRKIIAVFVAVILLLAVVACVSTDFDISKYIGSIVVYGAESANSTTVSGNIMAVFYTRDSQRVLFWCADVHITDNGDGTWDIDSPQVTAGGVNQALVEYGLYKYAPFQVNDETPAYLYDLDLEAVTADDLPESQHIGVLTAVNPALARPATVTRKYYGVLYDVQCLVDQDIVDMYQAGDLNIGDYVIVSFIDEIPNSTEINIAIITGKVFESWP